MSLKKVLVYGGAVLSLSSAIAAYAGSADVPSSCAACVSPFTPFLYLGLDAGWGYSNWKDFIGSGLLQSADNDGFAYGAKIGYQFQDHFGVEGGAFGLPSSDQTINIFLGPQTGYINVSGTVDSWFAYGAATIRAEFPGSPNFHILGKLGGAYRNLHHSGSLYNGVGDSDYTTVLLGATLEYSLAAHNLPLALGVDYFYVPGSQNAFFSSNGGIINSNAAPAAQVVAGSLSLYLAI